MNNTSTNQKKIPTQKPIITSYPRYANLISLTCNDENKLTWFYENLIPLQVYHDGKENILLDFHVGYNVMNLLKFCPVVWSKTFQRELIDRAYNDVVEFFIWLIDSGNAVYYLTRTKDIPAYNAYQGPEDSWNHDIMIHGYDREKELFYCCDFFTEAYKSVEVSFDNIRKGYYNLETKNNIDWLWGVVALTSHEKSIYDLKIHNVIDSLNDYVTGSSPIKHNEIVFYALDEEAHSFGINVYERVISYAQYIGENGFKADKRVFHTIYDHKQILLGMIKYLAKYGNVANGDVHEQNIISLCDMTLTVRNMILKYNMTGDKSIISRVIDRIRTIKEFEYNAIEALIHDIGTALDSNEVKNMSGSAEYLCTDAATQGDWINNYGKDGSEMSYIGRNINSPYLVNIKYKFKYCNEDNSRDVRSLLTTDGTKRISASYVGSVGKTIDIDFCCPEDTPTKVTLYFLDWWRADSSIIIRIYSNSDNKLLSEHYVANANDGIYVTYETKGHVIFKLQAANTDMVPYFSGIFVDKG